MDHAHHDHSAHHHHESSPNKMAASATLHCLTGCAIGEVSGLVIGSLIGLTPLATTALAIALAFVSGYTLSTLPLVKSGMKFLSALSIVFAADTLSIATMEVVDNLVMWIIPGAMDASLIHPLFWISMPVALAVAYMAAYPVNRYLLSKGKGHALTMKHVDHNAHGDIKPLVYGLAGLFIGGLLVSIAAMAIIQ